MEDNDFRRDCFNILRWILFSARPFWLEDITEACAILPRAGVLCDEEMRSNSHRIDLIEPLSGVIHVEQPLLEGDTDPRHRHHIVTLAHFSVGEYLHGQVHLTFNIQPRLFQKVEANRDLARACFAYLVYYHQQVAASSRKDLWKDFYMRDYAYYSWPTHLAACVPMPDSNETQRDISTALAIKIKNMITFPKASLYEDHT